MKKLIILISTMLLFNVLMGCSKTDPVTEELLSYINEQMVPLFTEEQELVNTYESVTGANFTDDETTYNVLVDKVIPGYNEFTGKVESVKIESKELREVHNIYIDGLNRQNSALTTIAYALEEQDIKTITEANEKLSEARKMMREYQDKVKELAEKYKVKLKSNS
ncbi:hypothetical protein GRF59_15030 [Paenibacillus sp. HJL G12]|uniref:Lipoprotein n=1 Tax=Paenibacillus dendrobii TaxID=2691084 RepID=A0A7X3IJ68_9BACL|nr:hypothetical protein [Paenibacillus dendrobii]MWV44934.1 hypothetical protein [Paenibacillus dendrobii]